MLACKYQSIIVSTHRNEINSSVITDNKL